MVDSITETGSLIQSNDTDQDIPVNPKRAVVYGSNLSGGIEFTRQLRAALESSGVVDPEVSGIKNVANIVPGFYHARLGGPTSIPRLVIIFPEMRVYGMSGSGLTVGTYDTGVDGDLTPFDLITALCKRHGVPHVYFTDEDVSNALELAVQQIPLLMPPAAEEK